MLGFCYPLYWELNIPPSRLNNKGCHIRGNSAFCRGIVYNPPGWLIRGQQVSPPETRGREDEAGACELGPNSGSAWGFHASLTKHVFGPNWIACLIPNQVRLFGVMRREGKDMKDGAGDTETLSKFLQSCFDLTGHCIARSPKGPNHSKSSCKPHGRRWQN